jgi:hypothetical protein
VCASRAAWLLPILLLASVCSSGCALLNTPEPAQILTPGTPEAPLTQTPLPTSTATPAPAKPADMLVLWVTDLIYSLKGEDAEQILEQQLAAFQATHPGLTV